MPDDTSPSWIRSARNVLGIVVGGVSFPVLVTLGHGLFASAGWLGAMLVLRLKGQTA